LREPVGGFESVLYVTAGTNPKNLGKHDSGSGGGQGIEGIFGVDQGAVFLFCGCCGQQGVEVGSASGGGGAGDFCENSARDFTESESQGIIGFFFKVRARGYGDSPTIGGLKD